MKLPVMEVTARGVPAHAALLAVVVLAVKAGWFANEMNITPQQAREMAAELLQAANAAEGKT